MNEVPGSDWTVDAINKLKELWSAGVSLEVISTTLHRDEQAVMAKAAELGLPQHAEQR